MTPKERASLAILNVYAKHCWGYDPNQHAELEASIEQQIVEAIAEHDVAWGRHPDHHAAVEAISQSFSGRREHP